MAIDSIVVNPYSNQSTAFGEVNVQTATPQATWNFQYNINDDIVKSTTTGSGAITQSLSHANLNTTANINSSAKIETLDAMRYTPGIGGVGKFTCVFTDGVEGNTQIIGIGDNNDGLFFGFNGTEFGILHRNAGNDEWTKREDWNVRKFPDYDHTKGNVFMIKFQWLGYGELKFYIEDPLTGGFELCHRIMYANKHTVTSLTNPTLPLMAEAKNTTNNTAITMRTPSGYIGIEGKVPEGINEVERGVDAIKANISTEVPIISIQNPNTYQGITNRQSAHIIFSSISSDGTKSANVRIYKGVVLVGASFTDVDTNATPLKLDTSSTSFSGGSKIISISLAKIDSVLLDLLTKLRPIETLTVTGESSSATEIDVSMVTHTLF